MFVKGKPMKNYTLIIVSILLLLVSGCTPDEEDSSYSSSDGQNIIGTWNGLSEQGLPVSMHIESRRDTLFITSYDFYFAAQTDTIHLNRNNPDGLGFVSADTFNLKLIHNNQNVGTSMGKFWNTNYLTGMLEVNELGHFYDFNYSATKTGYAATIHSAPQYSLIFEDGQVADYTYVQSYYSTQDTLHKQDKVVFSSSIYYDPQSPGQKVTLLEIRLGSLFRDYTADDFRQLILNGFKPFSVGADEGVEIIYRDKAENYKTWSTSFGSAAQGSSLFNISELLPLSGTDTTYLLYKFNATFNCIFYDIAGNEKKVVNANYLGLIGAWF
jgi:hypothetical protein